MIDSTQPTPALFSTRPMACAMCAATVVLKSATTQDATSPEMLSAPPNVWTGYVAGDVQPELVVVCSTLCLHRLLSL